MAGGLIVLRPAAFEAYALRLHSILGDSEKVTSCLESLLECEADQNPTGLVQGTALKKIEKVEKRAGKSAEGEDGQWQQQLRRRKKSKAQLEEEQQQPQSPEEDDDVNLHPDHPLAAVCKDGTDLDVAWCLEEGALSGGGIPAVARLLLLQRTAEQQWGAVIRRGGSPPAAAGPSTGAAPAASVGGLPREEKFPPTTAPQHAVDALLGAAASVLVVKCCEMVQVRLLAITAALLATEQKALAWLDKVKVSGGDLNAYTCALDVALARFPRPNLRQEAWQTAGKIMTGPNTSERGVCLRRLLPMLVKCSPRQEVVKRLTQYVVALYQGPSRAEIADALNLVVEFRGVLMESWQSWRKAQPTNCREKGWTPKTEQEQHGMLFWLVAAGLRLGGKEAAPCRRQARFLQEVAFARALEDPGIPTWLTKMRLTVDDAQAAWQTYWELFDALEASSSHLLISSWGQWLTKMSAFARRMSTYCTGHPATMLSQFWLELMLTRALGHANDTIQKFAISQLITMDLKETPLSPTFVYEELLPRLGRNADILYPRGDTTQNFEHQVTQFFVSFVTQFPQGKQVGPLLRALFKMQPFHHTPLRLTLAALLKVDARGVLSVEDALTLMEGLFTSGVFKLPVSTRASITAQVLRVLARFVSRATDAMLTDGCVLEFAAVAVAAIPDGLLEGLRPALVQLFKAALGDAGRRALELLQKLTAVSGRTKEAHGRMATAELTLGAVRIVWIMNNEVVEEGGRAGSDGSTPTRLVHDVRALLRKAAPRLRSQKDEVKVVAAPTGDFTVIAPPQPSAVATLLLAAYGASLAPEGGNDLMNNQPETRRELLGYLVPRLNCCLNPTDFRTHVHWVWLYALVLERYATPGLRSDIDEVLRQSRDTLRRQVKAQEARAPHGSPEAGAEPVPFSVFSATCFIASCAWKYPKLVDRADIFCLILSTCLQRPSGVDDRFTVSDLEYGDTWQRHRLEEHEDLHRPEREGVGRVIEWRDAMASFLVAKWRGLATLAMQADVCKVLAGILGMDPDDKEVQARLTKPAALGDTIIGELETLHPPHIAYWAVVARRVAYPVCLAFQDLVKVIDEERFNKVCSGLKAAIARTDGHSVAHMPRGCLQELTSAFCDPQLCWCERRLCHQKMWHSGPWTKALCSLLETGKESVGVLRGLAAPLIVSLLRVSDTLAQNDAATWAVDLYVRLLVASEAVIPDGALNHSPALADGLLDESGPGSIEVVSEEACSYLGKLCTKFGQTPGLSRILALAALDTTIAADRFIRPIHKQVLKRLLIELTVEAGLRPPGTGGSIDRLGPIIYKSNDQEIILPETWTAKSWGPGSAPPPMPPSPSHPKQLRGWQAMLVLGSRVDREMASWLLPELFRHLQTTAMPDVRDYQELLACALCAKFEDLALKPLLLPGLQAFDAPIQVCASHLVVACYMFQTWARTDCEAARRFSEASQSLLYAVVPFLCHNTAYVRGLAAWGFHTYLTCAKDAGMERELFKEEGQARQALLSIVQFLNKNTRCKNMRQGLKPIFVEFDPAVNTPMHCLAHQSAVLPALGESAAAQKAAKNASHIFSKTDFEPRKAILDMIKEAVDAEMKAPEERSDPTAYPSASEEWRLLVVEKIKAAEAASAPVKARTGIPREDTSKTFGASGMQRKFEPPARPVCAADGEGRAALRRTKVPLVVASSLVDITANVAGLSRTCEIFGCSSMWVANLQVTKESAFQTIAVNSERWLPMREVSRGDLRSQLLEMRDQGFALVGVEQTHNSVVLSEWQFSDRTVLVLGNEKRGIDADVLPILDACVEIPQVGQLRSLNVHVSGSLAVWEYTRQRRERAALGASGCEGSSTTATANAGSSSACGASSSSAPQGAA